MLAKLTSIIEGVVVTTQV